MSDRTYYIGLSGLVVLGGGLNLWHEPLGYIVFGVVLVVAAAIQWGQDRREQG